MHCRSLFALFCFVCLSSFASAQTTVNGIIYPSAANRQGFNRSWFAQVQLDGITDELVHVNPYVFSTKGTILFELESKSGKIRVTEHDRNTYGEIIGPDGAQKKAEALLAKLQAKDPAAKMNKIVVPKVMLIAVTKRGVVQAIDGESGKTLWRRQVGQPNQGVTSAASNEDVTAVVVGVRIFILENSDGRERFNRKMVDIPGAGPRLSNEYCYIPMIRGRVVSITLDGNIILDKLYMSPGQVRVRPTYTSRSIAWPSSRGHLYVANAHRKGVRFRLEAGSAITSEVSYVAPDKLVTTSLDGFVYCLAESGGSVIWRYSTGEPIADSSILIDDATYVRTEADNLICLNTNDGTLRWMRSKVDRILSASKDHVFCMDKRKNLIALDTKTGSQSSRLPMPSIDFFVENKETDRIYVGTKAGIVQCIHHSHLEFPVPHGGAPELEAKPEEPPEEDMDKGAKPAAKPMPKGNDPFGAPAGGGNDPFGAPAKGGGGKDPFGNPGGAGGGGAKKPAGNDPFGNPGGGGGGGNDPFGMGN